MTEILEFENSSLQVFAYEAFDYTIVKPEGEVFIMNILSNSGGLNPSYLRKFGPDDGFGGVQFSATGTSNTFTAGTTEFFILGLTDQDGAPVTTARYTVSIGAGRLLDSNAVSLSNTAYTFFKNESITQTLGRPFRVVSPSFGMKLTSVPALPPGLRFVRIDDFTFNVQGSPTVVVPNRTYQFIGVETLGSKIATTKVNMIVSNERLQINLSGASIIGGMEIGTAITPRVFTCIPPQSTSTIKYTFPTLPSGIVAQDILGSNQLSPFFPTDPSFTMIITGTPTRDAAVSFANAGVDASGTNLTVQVSAGLLTSNQPLTFAFGETVLFDNPVLLNNYVDVPVDASLNFFRARTYFTSNVPISNISSTGLPPGLSLNFIPSLGRANLVGTPTVAGSDSYTFRATNSNGFFEEIVQTIAISNDVASFSSPVGVDLCYNFILSRPLTQFKDGYYTSNIRFIANAASGRAVTLSAPELIGTGLSLDSNGLLVGLPSTVTPLTTLNVLATVEGSPARATKSVNFAILNDEFDFFDISASTLTFIQNIETTPFQIPVTTLSDRNVIGYSQTGFPTGISISSTGIVSGIPSANTPTSGVVTITASTGYTSGSSNYNFTLIPDSMLFVVRPTQYSYIAGDAIGNIDVDAVTFSGTTVSNFGLSITPTYGLTINSSTGVISGTWTNGLPPNDLLPSSCNFSMTAQAGGLTGVLPINFTADPILSNAMLFVAYGNLTGGSDLNSFMYSAVPENISSFTRISNVSSTSAFSDIQYKNNDPNNNVVLALTVGTAGDPNLIFRGTRIDNFTSSNLDPLLTYYPNMSKLMNIPGTSTWYIAGTMLVQESIKTVFVESEDNGLTWDFENAKQFGISSRDLNTGSVQSPAPYSKKFDPYLRGGVAMAYGCNVWVAGGALDPTIADQPVMVYSTNFGENWIEVGNGFAQECATINADDSGVWIATGSSVYKTYDFATGTGVYTNPATTIKYSFDQGRNWIDASGTFTMLGNEVVYANGTWLASGTNGVLSDDVEGEKYFVPELRYSTNGANWIKADLRESALFNQSNTIASNAIAPLRIGSMNFDGEFWNVFVNEETPENGHVQLYRHDAISDLDTGWFAIDLSGSTTQFPLHNSNTRFLSLTPPRYLYTGEPPTQIELSISANSVNGPTFTSPISSSFLQYQYMRIEPIQLSATGTGQVYFFVETATLPPGLNYNRITNQITGTSVQIGQVSTIVFAKDDIGSSSFTLTFTTVVPRIIRQQDGAGSYTSLLRQYTEVLGAQNARDNRALPNQERALGEFMSPEAPDVITQTIDPKCRKSDC